ncbi:MAG TPA: DcaP family trimeric outer membrane transporter [Steroidobacteraceae bacterium]|jgi:hypothetical protein|nr:DcaP family trimeric outer membrane transporter [Steroidobacteraceae bacterium]
MGSVTRFARRLSISLPALGALVLTAPTHAADPEKSFEVYGFAQVDYIQDFKRVDPAWEDTLRPSKIPTTEGQFGSDGQASVSAKQSRLGVQGTLPVEGSELYAKFEFDLFGVGVDAGQFTIRPRHIYGQWRQFLGGQTNSLFMDIDLFPNVVDYWGPAGMVFLRTPQIRWTPISGDTSFAVAIEKPGNDIDPGQVRILDPGLGANIRNDEKAPDITAQLRFSGDWGHVLLGAIARRIGFDTLGTPNNEPKNHRTGWGADLGSSFNLRQKDKIILGVVYGEGIASYMNDGGVDLAPDDVNGAIKPKAVPLLGVIAYYDLYWSEKFSSSFGYSRTQVENTTLQTPDAFFKGEYASVNLLYYPGEKMLIGVEGLWGRRTDNNGATGDDYRVQVSFKYSFSSKDFSS